MASVGRRVRSLRESKELTQGQLATYAGIGNSTVSLIESGERPNPGAEVLAKLAKALNTTIDYLTGLTDDPHPRPSPQALGAVEAAAGDPLFREIAEAWPDLNDKDRSVLHHMTQSAATLRRRQREEDRDEFVTGP